METDLLKISLAFRGLSDDPDGETEEVELADEDLNEDEEEEDETAGEEDEEDENIGGPVDEF